MENNKNKNTENTSNKREEFYKKLKESLDTTTSFPSDYLFKFIVPTEHSSLNLEKEALLKEKENLDKKDTDAILINANKIDAINAKIKAEDEKLKQVDAIFKGKNPTIQTKKSKSGKYTSKSIKVKMNSSDDVINSYKEAEDIDGIISL